MKISILLSESYPFGMASTNRIHLYAKGIVESGNDVEILIPGVTEEYGKVRNHNRVGEYEGVKFKYACNPVRSKSFIGRRIQNVASLINSVIILIRFKPKIILVVSNSFKYILLAKICSVIIRAKIIREKSEVPFYKIEVISGIRRIRTIAEFKLFDGIIVISGALKDFFLKDLSLKTKVLEVPILINISEKPLIKNEPGLIEPNMVYTGSLLNNKDGVLTIIKAFVKVLPNHPNAKLILTGDLEKSVDKKIILSLIDELSIKEKVVLTGYISKEKLLEITSTAAVLLLAKPDNRQNRYNMATKIGEYLLTGRPALISDVDPASLYLSHRRNAFIVKPEEDQIAKELEFILNNPKEAEEIGFSGKEIALKLFDYKIHAGRMIDFFKAF